MSAPAREVAVIGGGPAGLAAAIAARARGLTVAVVEPRRGPIDKACGEGLMPEALAALATLGVELAGAGRAFAGVRWISDGTLADAEFPDGARGRGVARTELHAALLARAEAVGVERIEARAVALAADGIVTTRGEVAARFVVGADGLHSKVRGWAGLAGAEAPRRRFGVRRHLALEPEGERVEVVFGAGAEAYLTPLGARTTGVALLWEGAARGFDDLLARRFPPSLAARCAGARALGRDRGAGPFEQRVRRAAAGRVALVGDAAGYLDAVTGEGLAIAFREALALAPALAAGDLARYARASAALRRRPEAITRLVLALARRPALRRRAVAALAADPAFFGHLLGALGAGRRLGELGGGAALRFGARLLAPHPAR
jgi:flavin-dependent dehydrogenase